MPSDITGYIIAIRAADSLKNSKEELLEQKNIEVRKKLNQNILELEQYFK